MSTWIFHRGALGDSILLWPALRTLGPRAMLVTDASRAHLAARYMGIHAMDIEQRRFNELWITGATMATPIRGVERILTFLAPESTEAGGTWVANASRLFPGASISTRPAPLDRCSALALDGLPPAHPAPRDNPDGPIILHVGAGSPDKRWPMPRWEALAARLPSPVIIAGEVERERFSADERAAFTRLHGLWIDSLDALAALLASARLVIANDSGPGHLAAQLGIRTLSLFGPTDPALWAPIGPRATFLAPPTSRPMDWLTPERVLAAVA